MRHLSVFLTACLLTNTLRAGAEDIDFARDVRPILLDHCVRCHGPRKQEGGLRLDLRDRALRGGDSGKVLVAGSPVKSDLLRRITATDEERMPPSGKPLTDLQVSVLKRWIEQGLPWPDELAGTDAASAHWAFLPVQRPTPPAVATGAHNEIDQFLLARLAKTGSRFAAEADRSTLLRRLHLDLIGLPPTAEETDAYLRDGPQAYERLVDRLLASPHFGERWGRHWLDLARFAESDGYENDRIRPDAWRYRDWVIASFNRDQPFDQFTIEQLAGDLLPTATAEQKIAAGMHRNTLWNSAASGDKEEFRTLAIKDRTDTTGTAWLGLTLGCAQCHSHKYDPLAQREYYQLYAFFNNTDNDDVATPGGRAQSLRAVMRPTHVHRRGNFLDKGEAVEPLTPAFLPTLPVRGKQADRLDLARWLVDPAHPLVARVTVNHIWSHLFGQGLVRTPENFGIKGELPTHPELLDWLASEFVRLKWSRKQLIRTIVLSAAYRQSSDVPAAGSDPDNLLVGRQNRVRVEAEIVRDLALAASGLLDRKLGGPSIVPPFPEGLLAHRFTAEALKMPTADHRRRSVYIHVQRTLMHPLLATFDATDGNQPCPQRDRSTTPLQALTLLNDPVFHECAKALGARMQKAAAASDERLRHGYLLCLNRNPSDSELGVLRELVQAQEKLGARPEIVWLGVARTLLNLDEFINRR